MDKISKFTTTGDFVDFLTIILLSIIVLFVGFLLFAYRELKTIKTVPESESYDVQSNSELTRDLSEFNIIMIGVGGMIGAGIFILTGIAAGIAGPAIILAFLLNGFISIFNSMAYAELGSAIPEAGGGFLWIRSTMGHFQGFMSGWMSWFAHIVAGGLYALGFGSFSMLVIQDVFGWHDIHLFSINMPNLDLFLNFTITYAHMEIISAIIIIIIFIAINYVGSSETGSAETVVTMIKLAIISFYIICGLYVFVLHPVTSSQNLIPMGDFFPKGVSGVILAMGLTFIAFEGYEIIVQSGEEVINPRSSIPKAVFKSLMIVIPLYILVAFVSLASISTPGGIPTYVYLGQLSDNGIIEVAKQFVPFGFYLLLFGGLVSTISALNATTYSSSRVAFVMGRDRFLPKQFGTVNKARHTPHIALIASGLIMIFSITFLPLVSVAAAADFMFLLLFLQVNIAIFRMRDRYEDKLQYGYKSKLFPYSPYIAILAMIFLIIVLITYEPLAFVGALVWLSIGTAIFKFFIRKEVSTIDFSQSLKPFFKEPTAEELQKKQTQFFQYDYENPDEFFVALEKILMPVSGNEFEWMSIGVATVLAKKFNAEIILFHIGNNDLGAFTSYLSGKKVRFDLKIKKKGNVPELINQELREGNYTLLIMPSRRRKRYLDKFKFDSVSAKVIPYSKCDILQIYSTKIAPYTLKSLSLENIFLLMSYSRKDPFLLFFANSFLTTNGKIFAYRFLQVPVITPLQQSMDGDAYKDEINKFFSLIENYGNFLSTDIIPKLVLCHDVEKSIPSTLKNEPIQPSLVVFGNSRRPKWYRIRNLSDKLIDKLNSSVIVYYSKKNGNNK